MRMIAAPLPAPVRRISFVPVIRCARYLERIVSVVNKDRLTEANRTKHSSALSYKETDTKFKMRCKCEKESQIAGSGKE